MAILAVAAALSLAACATGKPLSSSPQAGGARGTVATSAVPSGKRVAIRVERLPLPSQVGPDATTFVVWVRAIKGGEPSKLGTLALDGQDGTLDAATSLSSFELFITAEPSATTSIPWGEKILWTEVKDM